MDSMLDYLSKKSSEEDKMFKVHTIHNILYVESDTDGFFKTKIALGECITTEEYDNFFKDGWPVYTGEKEWAFVVRDPIFKSEENVYWLTLRSKSPIYNNQNLAFLNQQDTSHYSNEEIMSAVDALNRFRICNRWTGISSSYDIKSSGNSFSAFGSNNVNISFHDLESDPTVYYHNSEIATNDHVNTVVENVIMDRINPIEQNISALNEMDSYLLDQINNLKSKNNE